MDKEIDHIMYSDKYGKIIVYKNEPYKSRRQKGNRHDDSFIVEFESGYTTRTTLNLIKMGKVIDRYRRCYFGVGYVGDASTGGENGLIFMNWKKLLEKCYDQNSYSYRFYGAKGFYVCDYWLCFANFVEDYKKLLNDMGNKKNVYLVIKPILIANGIKEYSMNNCIISSTEFVIDPNVIYKNKYGDYRILYYTTEKSPHKVMIEFITTGYRTEVLLNNVRYANFLDPYFPKICGIGYVGGIVRHGHELEYQIWLNMIYRCYDPGASEYQSYGQIGVTVDSRWHSFENFYNDLPTLPGYAEWKEYGPMIYQLDKDKLQQGIPKELRVYSKETCCFISKKENNAIRIKDYYNNNKNVVTNYFGVSKAYKGYSARVYYNGRVINLGIFNTPEAAANARDYYAAMYDNMNYNYKNGTPFMSPYEWKQECRTLNIGNLPKPPMKEMCQIIK